MKQWLTADRIAFLHQISANSLQWILEVNMFDAILEGLIVVILVWMMFRSKANPNQPLVLFGMIFLTGLHLSTGLIRWQQIPVYMTVMGVLLLQAKVLPVKRWVKGTLLTFLFFSAVANQAFPLYSMPVPSGPSQIGTQSYVLEDASREEIYSSSGSTRRFKIQMWYPAEITEGFEQALWIEDGVEVKRALAVDMGLPGFVFDPLATFVSSAYLNAPLRSQTLPYDIVIISHGWSSLRTLHTDLAEELASHGMMVIAIEHTYGSLATRFSETDIEFLNRQALPRRAVTPDYLDYANRLVNTYAGDIRFTLDWLEATSANPDHWLYNRIQPASVTVIGHSTGGGAAVKAAMIDERIERVIGFDPWVEPLTDEEIANGTLTPSLYLRSEAWEVGENNRALLPLLKESPNTTLYQLQGTTHYDFAMVYMFSPLSPLLGVTGSLDREWLNDFLFTTVRTFIETSDASQFIGSVDELKLIS
jgi:predicted dienelactone hydrolase